MSIDVNGLRVLAVHAHPDDEALFTGGVLAQLRRLGAQVQLVTAALGEEGEVIGDTFSQLTVDHADQLGGFRVLELDAATQALDIDYSLLGGAGHFRDSGMAGSPAHDNPRALVNRVDEASELIRDHIDDYQPHLIFTYGPDGGYGHPDHIAVHKAVHAAVEQTNWPVSRIWWAIIHREETYAALETITEPQGWTKPDKAYLDNFTNEEADVAIELGDTDLAAKRLALAAHATQIWMADGTVSRTNPHAAFATIAAPDVAPHAFALSNLHVMPLTRREHFQLGYECDGVRGAADNKVGIDALVGGVFNG